MNVPNLHLNLLRPDEKASSSPVRLRVMLPILSLRIPMVTLKSWRSRASCSSQYSFMDSIQSTLPYRKAK